MDQSKDQSMDQNMDHSMETKVEKIETANATKREEPQKENKEDKTEQKKDDSVRFGFTTGSCAAAAAKAAVYMVLTGKEKREITIETPKGIPYHAKIVDTVREEETVSCAVIKDGGSDPDVTTGCHVFATVQLILESALEEPFVEIDGGEGVGRVTLPGLDQPVGNAAINHVPRQMIEKEVLEVCRLCDYHGGISVLISVPEGRELAEKTFNPRLGIVDGISILGTSGIVEPMSSKALLDTIQVELKQKKALGFEYAAVSPGNYGLDFMKQTYDYDLDKSVKCSNYIGDTIDMAKELGFKGMLLTGHIGKLIKVSGGIMNTHSKEGDCRMELLASAGLHAGCDADTARAILNTVVTEEGIKLLKEAGVDEKAMEYMIKKIMFFLKKRAGDDFEIQCMVYCNQYGMLAKSEGAEEMLKQLQTY